MRIEDPTQTDPSLGDSVGERPTTIQTTCGRAGQAQPHEPTKERRCTACGEIKPLQEFYLKGHGRREGKCVGCRPKRSRGKKPRNQNQRSLSARVRFEVGSTPAPHLIPTLANLLQAYLPESPESQEQPQLSVDELLDRDGGRNISLLIEEER